MPSPPAGSAAVLALEWSEAIERHSGALPRRRGIRRSSRERAYFHDKRLAFVSDLADVEPLPCQGLFVDQVTGRPMLVPKGPAEARSQSAADVAIAGAMRTEKQFRFRSYFLTADRPSNGPTTLAVHQRAAPATPTPLVSGARIAKDLDGRAPFVVPRVLDQGVTAHGLRGGGVADWVVEPLLDGAVVRGEDAQPTVVELIDLLGRFWPSLGVDHAVLPQGTRDRIRKAMAALADDPPEGMWPHEVDGVRLRHRITDVVDNHAPMTIGLSHGDPGLGNVLRMSDGRLALVDWEDAGRRPVAHDVVKALMSAPDPMLILPTLAAPVGLRPAMEAAQAAAWNVQLAAALLMFLSGWQHRHRRAVTRRSVVPNNRRMQRMITVLDALLDG